MNTEIQKQFIISLAKFRDRSFIISALHLLDTDEQRQKIIDYIAAHPDATKTIVNGKMAYLSVGMDYKLEE